MTCTDIRPLLGVYVLDKADPTDRALVEEHLAGCARCRDELADLEGLPALLALIPPSEAARRGMPPGGRGVEPSAEQLPRLLAAASATRTRRRRLSLVAAALLLVAGLGGLTLAIRQASAPETPPVTVATWVATDRATGTAATVTLTPRPAGTAIGLTLSGVPAGTRCSLVVTALDGTTSSAASWEADYAGTASVTGFTATPIGQIRDLAVVASTGGTLATITPAAVPSSTSR
jgi:AcrR family transcriptional regulator